MIQLGLGTGNGFYSFFIFESDNIFVLLSWPETWFNIQCHMWQYDVNMMYGNVHSEPSMYHLDEANDKTERFPLISQ